jgi:polyisoprenoid-binding protein YceI
MRKIILVCFFNLLVISVYAQKEVQVKSATVSFQIKNAGLMVNGSFKEVKASIYFDENNLSNSSMNGSLSVNSIETGIGLRNNHLKKGVYFNVEKFPTIFMKSIKFEKKDKMYLGYFLLTIKGVTKETVVDFSVSKNNIEGSFIVNRLDFGVGDKSFVMANEVIVSVNLIQ